jgi:hypothetical protein
MSDAAVVEQNQPVAAPEPVERKAATDMIEGFEGRSSVAPGGNQWDGEKSEWVNPTTVRDDKGRFAKVRESLEQSQKKAEYVRLAKAGAIEPDESMDASTWAAVRQAQIDAGMDKINVPESFLAEAEPAEKENANEGSSDESFSEEEKRHFTNHNAMITNAIAKMAIDGGETRAAVDGFDRAYREYGIEPRRMVYMGHCIAECENPHEVLLALGKKPEVVATLSGLSAGQMHAAVQRLSQEISAAKPRPRQTNAPPPPDPVSARPVVAAFDANDESLSADEWLEKREAQLAAKRKR